MFGLLGAGNSVSAAAVMNADADPANDRIVAALTAYQRHLRAQESQLSAQAASTSSTARWAIVLFTLAAVATAAALATVLTRRIRRRLRRMLSAAEGIAVGELDHDVATDSTDEIGDTARAFERMMAYLHGLADAVTRVAQGDLTVTVAPKSDARRARHRPRRDGRGAAPRHRPGLRRRLAPDGGVRGADRHVERDQPGGRRDRAGRPERGRRRRAPGEHGADDARPGRRVGHGGRAGERCGGAGRRTQPRRRRARWPRCSSRRPRWSRRSASWRGAPTASAGSSRRSRPSPARPTCSP